MILSSKERKIIMGIRAEAHDISDGDLRVCDTVAYDIQTIFGWPMCVGSYLPENQLYFHCWNLLPDGCILDATADQFGHSPIVIVGENDDAYKNYEENPKLAPQIIEQARQFTMSI